MNRRTLCTTAAALLAALVLTAPASAKEPGKDKGKGKDPEALFAKKDTNGDGKVTLEEFKVDIPADKHKAVEKRFKKIDANGDGGVTLEEFKAGLKKAQEGKKKKEKKG